MFRARRIVGVVACLCVLGAAAWGGTEAATAGQSIGGGFKILKQPRQLVRVGNPFTLYADVVRLEPHYELTHADVSGQPPPGVALTGVEVNTDHVDGPLAFTGTPTAAGKYTFEIVITAEEAACAPSCGSNQTLHGQHSFTVVVEPAPQSVVIEPTSPTSTQMTTGARSPMEWSFEAAGVKAPYNSVKWTFTGSPPAGVHLANEQSLAALLGVPEVPGTYKLTLEARAEKAGCTSSCPPTQVFKLPVTLTVEPTASRVKLEPVSAKLPKAVENLPYSLPFTVSGTWTGKALVRLADGTLPPGLELPEAVVHHSHEPNGVPAVLSGSPTAAGTWTFTVSAEESGCREGSNTTPCGLPVSRTYTLAVEPLTETVRFETEAGLLVQRQGVQLEASALHLELGDTSTTSAVHSIDCVSQSFSGSMRSANNLRVVEFAIGGASFIGDEPEAQECRVTEGPEHQFDQLGGGRVVVTTNQTPTAPWVFAATSPTISSRRGEAGLSVKAQTGKIKITTFFPEFETNCTYEAGAMQGTYGPGQLAFTFATPHSGVGGEGLGGRPGSLLVLSKNSDEECPPEMALGGTIAVSSNGELVSDFN
jgi:hypothetical protein